MAHPCTDYRLTVICRPDGVTAAANSELAVGVIDQRLEDQGDILGRCGLGDAEGSQLRRDGKVGLGAILVSIAIRVQNMFQTSRLEKLTLKARKSDQIQCQSLSSLTQCRFTGVAGRGVNREKGQTRHARGERKGTWEEWVWLYVRCWGGRLFGEGLCLRRTVLAAVGELAAPVLGWPMPTRTLKWPLRKQQQRQPKLQLPRCVSSSLSESSSHVFFPFLPMLR